MPRLRLLPPVEVVSTIAQAIAVRDSLLRRDGPIAIDTETTGLNFMKDRILFWSMATNERRFFFDVDPTHDVLPAFEPLFSKPTQRWYLTNAKYDAHMLLNRGAFLAGELWDIIVMDAMDDDTRPHGLKDQAWLTYGARWGEFKQMFLDPSYVAREIGLDRDCIGQFRKYSVGERLTTVYNNRPDLVQNYATCDAYFTYLLAESLKDTLAATPTPNNFIPEIATSLDYFQAIEVPFTRVLFNLERRGIAVDINYRKEIAGPLKDGIQAAEHAMSAVLGGVFDNGWDSKDDLRLQLFSEDYPGFGLKPLKTTGDKTGTALSAKTPVAAVDEKTLSILLLRPDTSDRAKTFIKAYMERSKLHKLFSTYVRDLEEIVFDNNRDGAGGPPQYRIHTKYNQAGARTSRISSSEPNLQNIPVRGDKHKIRGIFVATPGYRLISRDYPQIEFRVAAFLAGEEPMMEAIRKGWDVHTANAVRMFGKKHPEVTYEAIEEARRKKDAKEPLTDLDKLCLKCRDSAKAIGLGTMYGEGPRKIAADLGCTLEESKAQIKEFFTANPAIKQLIEDMKEFARVNEMTHTLLGRIRRLWRINNDVNYGIAAAEERQAPNTLIQGSAAEMLKLAMIILDNHVEFAALGARVLLTVHDELIAEAPEANAERAGEIMDEVMGNPYNLPSIVWTPPIPVTPDGVSGYRWSELK